MTTMVVKRGDIFYADLSPVIGSEQGGIRPVIIIQNDIGNKYSPTVIVAAITSQINKAEQNITNIDLETMLIEQTNTEPQLARTKAVKKSIGGKK